MFRLGLIVLLAALGISGAHAATCAVVAYDCGSTLTAFECTTNVCNNWYLYQCTSTGTTIQYCYDADCLDCDNDEGPLPLTAGTCDSYWSLSYKGKQTCTCSGGSCTVSSSSTPAPKPPTTTAAAVPATTAAAGTLTCAQVVVGFDSACTKDRLDVFQCGFSTCRPGLTGYLLYDCYTTSMYVQECTDSACTDCGSSVDLQPNVCRSSRMLKFTGTTACTCTATKCTPVATPSPPTTTAVPSTMSPPTTAAPSTAPSTAQPSEAPPTPEPPAPTIGEVPKDWEYRLVGDSDLRGRLEVRPVNTSTWGTVCSEGFSLEAAKVACRSLGFNGITGWNVLPDFGGGRDVISMQSVSCTGEETDLASCSFRYQDAFVLSTCNHDQDVGIECVLSEWQYRLRGSAPGAGLLEVIPASEDQFGTVCSDGFTMTEANVACKSLGFSAGALSYSTAAESTAATPLPGEGEMIFIAQAECAGTEARLEQCALALSTSYMRLESCTHSQDIVLTCSLSNESVPPSTPKPAQPSTALPSTAQPLPPTTARPSTALPLPPSTARPTSAKPPAPTTAKPLATTLKPAPPTTLKPAATTLKPATPKPVTTTLKPATPKPVTTTLKPATPKPVTTTLKPTTLKPTTLKPATPKPGTTTLKPTTLKPATPKPATTTLKPTTLKPATPKPATPKPTTKA